MEVLKLDYDSGYVSHQESNSDSFIENMVESMPNSSRPIYLNEDALLEKPELNDKPKTLDMKIQNEDSRISNDFSPDFKNFSCSSDTTLSASVVSQSTSYSGFDDSECDKSREIPLSKQVIVYTEDKFDDSVLDNQDCNNGESELLTNSCDHYELEKCISSQCPRPLFIDLDKKDENNSALSNITNKCSTINEKKRKLTLIFSKDDKENVYKVQRKYPSISPQKCEVTLNSCTPEISRASKNLGLEIEKEISTLTKRNLEQADETGIMDISDNQETCKSIQIEISEIQDIKESPKQELILRKELDLEKLVLQQDHLENYYDSQKELKRHTIENEKSAKDNSLSVTTPSKVFVNPVDPNISPDLFEHEEILEQMQLKALQSSSFIAEEQYILKKDRTLLKRTQNSLQGVLPPQSITIINLSIDEMLNRIETNKEYFWTGQHTDKLCCTSTSCKSNEKLNTSDESSNLDESKSLLITEKVDCLNTGWPNILHQRYHGLHHNRSKISEKLEDLFAKYGQRYVGAETQSSCTVFETNHVSPTKRKQVKQRWAVKSPGRRLSHLAKRRITFSNANLQGNASIFGSRARQILVDARKLDLLNRRKSPRKSPRKNVRKTPRKTPSKSPSIKSRTPSSSAKKKLAMRFRELTGEIEKTMPSTSSSSIVSSKRALFMSPDRDVKASLFQPSTSGLSSFQNELKKPGTKRTLFLSPSKRSPMKNSPFKRSPFKRLDLGNEKKRKRVDGEDDQPLKFSRSMSMDVRPSESERVVSFSKNKSEMNISANRSQLGTTGDLSAVHKKKLQWAVYEALRSQNITHTHPQFKVFASVLARVTRRFLPNLTSAVPKECGTTEKMLRIARIHVYSVIKGKSVDEIINDYLKTRTRSVKPQGYIAPEQNNVGRRLSEVSSTVTSNQVRLSGQEMQDKKRLEQLGLPKPRVESRIDRIRKVINFGDDSR